MSLRLARSRRVRAAFRILATRPCTTIAVARPCNRCYLAAHFYCWYATLRAVAPLVAGSDGVNTATAKLTQLNSQLGVTSKASEIDQKIGA